MDRYRRQTAFKGFGIKGQEKLATARIVLVGCGGLGSSIAELLVRSGVGYLTIIEGDKVEEHNLHRQLLYSERDVGERKVYAAMRNLKDINSTTTIEIHDTLLNFSNLHLLKGADIIMDGTDNLHTRFLINDYAVKNWISWIYGGAVASEGMTASFVPGGPCLRCLFPDIPPPGSMATCQSEGVLGTLPTLVASFQATEAIKILTGKNPRRTLLYINPWRGVWREVVMEKRPDCPCCSVGDYPFLEAREKTVVTALCQGDSVKIVPLKKGSGLVDRMKRRYPQGSVKSGRFIMTAEGSELVVMDDGTAIITGLDTNAAQELYSTYVGW